MALFRKLFPTAGALLIGATTLSAQAPTACDVSATKGALAKASFSVEQARGAQGTPAANAIMTSAIKQLEAAKGEDPTVQALYLGQTLAFWLSQPGMSLTPRRGSLGFVQNPDATIELIPTIDSLFRVVETAKPACSDVTAAYRGGLPGYLALVNGSINALNADKLDSAEIYATNAHRLYPASPYGTMVLGSIASKRKDDAKALQYWEEAAKAAAHDSIYRDVERQVLANEGLVYLNTANTGSGAQRAEAAKHAADVYTRLLAVPGNAGSYASSSRQNLQAAQLLLGDTASLVASYQPLLANPSGFGYQDLLNSAVSASRANRNADAAKLFEASLAQNPYSRDALFNVAVVYLAEGENAKVGPIVQRLIAIDPSNPENFNLAARAYLALAKAAQTAKRVPVAAAYNDTTMSWYNRGNALPTDVVVTEFSAGDKQVTIAGTVTDRRDKAAAAAAELVRNAAPARGAKAKAKAAPAAASTAATPVTVTFEALDKTGAVLGTQTVTTDALTPGKSANFRTTIPANNAVAYRYRIGS